MFVARFSHSGPSSMPAERAGFSGGGLTIARAGVGCKPLLGSSLSKKPPSPTQHNRLAILHHCAVAKRQSQIGPKNPDPSGRHSLRLQLVRKNA
jgi:hypothetical protein